jgi:PEP-CTERM motif-containing protein
MRKINRSTGFKQCAASSMAGLIFSGLAIAFTAGTAASASTYNNSADFSLASNPNGVWSYGYETTLGGSLTLYNVTSTPDGQQVWNSSGLNVDGTPGDLNNPTNAVFAGIVPAHTAIFSPGPADQLSVYRFTSPSTGVFNLSASFKLLDSGATDVYILENGTELFSAALDQASLSASFSKSLVLAKGDLVDFEVGFPSNGSFYSDTTAVNATLTAAVPEPCTWAMMLLGFAGLGFMAHRRKSNPALIAA